MIDCIVLYIFLMNHYIVIWYYFFLFIYLTKILIKFYIFRYSYIRQEFILHLDILIDTPLYLN